MAFVDVNPRYRALLDRQGLIAPADFLDLQGVLVGGHADRDIARVTLGEGPERFTAYLKREQHLRWRDRLGNAWAGFGFVSRSSREAQLLRQLRQANIGCPEVVAVGEDRQGRAFLLVRELTGMVDLRRFLTSGFNTFSPRPGTRGRGVGGEGECHACPLTPDPSPPRTGARGEWTAGQRREIAVRLGRALAGIHAAGFHHPDLYSKHVLVGRDRASGAVTFAFLDWQRADRRLLTWARCWRQLAALDATVADDLVTQRERLTCLHAYCRSYTRARCASKGLATSLAGASGSGGKAVRLTWAVRAIQRHALRLLRRRRIREMRRPLLAADCHQLVPLTSSALCMTRQFRDELAGHVPAWLRFSGEGRPDLVRTIVPVTPTRQAALIRRRVSRPLGWFWHWLRGRPLVSPEVAQAGTLFRLERYGIRTPRLLAFGQRGSRPWRLESLLVTEAPDDAVPLRAWLRRPGPAATQQQRRHLVREVGEVLRHMHEAACYLGEVRSAQDALRVQALPDGSPRVLLAAVEAIRQRHRPAPRFARRDLATLWSEFNGVCGRTDVLRCLLAYLDVPRLTPEARRLAGRLLGAPAPVRRRVRMLLRRGNA